MTLPQRTQCEGGGAGGLGAPGSPAGASSSVVPVMGLKKRPQSGQMTRSSSSSSSAISKSPVQAGQRIGSTGALLTGYETEAPGPASTAGGGQ